MDLTTYERLIKTEFAARNYLLGFALKTINVFAPGAGLENSIG